MDTLIEVRNLQTHFFMAEGVAKAVDGTAFAIRRGQVLGVVGENGCGKTTVGRLIMRLYAPTAGEVHFRPHGEEGENYELAAMDHAALRPVRTHLQMIFQDPYSSLNPRKTILDTVGEPLRLNGTAKGSELEDRVVEMLRPVGLRPGVRNALSARVQRRAAPTHRHRPRAHPQPDAGDRA